MTKKIEIFHGGQTGQYPKILLFFSYKATFLPVNTHEPSQRWCMWVSCNILPNFMPKYWQENCSWRKL